MRSKLASWCVAAMLLALTAVPVLAAGRGWLGVTTQATDEDLRRGLDLTRDGLLVNQVSQDSPADHAGLKKGDVILTYNSRTVSQPEDLRQLVRDTDPGRNVSLGVWRDGSRRTLQVTVGDVPSAEENGDDDQLTPTPERPSPPEAPRAPRTPRAPRAPRDSDHGDMHRRVIINGREIPEDQIDDNLKDQLNMEGMPELKALKALRGMPGWNTGPGGSMFFAPSASRGRLGVRIEKLNDDLGQALGVDGNKGVLVTEVLDDTPAKQAGLRAGDVIVKVGDDSVDTPDELVEAVDGQDGKVKITVLRKGVRREVQAELEDRSDARARSRARGDLERQLRNPEPGQGNRVYRMNTKNDAGDEADLREELRQLKQELRELREQMKQDKK